MGHGQGACTRGCEGRSRTKPTFWMRLREVDGRGCKPLSSQPRARWRIREERYVGASLKCPKAWDGGLLRRSRGARGSCVTPAPTASVRSGEPRGRVGMNESRAACVGWPGADGSYLVDPASSHMLVSKIKPCMSKYKLLCIVKLRMAH